ncbi:5-formyltetrahydrofolate cyclo-ligase [Helicobacter baculiformis]|uniref:5-formyltetrahydrofolate cyclo-ligase n=1 Tax=Helicobacter baculiformis TaxID=427351 RepID=A0ABV7ZJN3_9HELI|nr:5-formyltetrahydrofolate cyclo-ligase [Helicobacter baculiformis]
MTKISKAQFRTLCKTILFKKRGWDIKDHKIIAQLKPLLKPYKRLLLYCHLPHEPNLMPLIAWARRHKIKVFVPTLQQGHLHATPYRLPLVRKTYHILEPSPTRAYFKPLELAIVPVLGIDKAGRRIGFGKGYYDLFFATHPKIPIIFTARQILQSQSLLGENHDIVSARYLDQRTPNKINKRITNGIHVRDRASMRAHGP